MMGYVDVLIALTLKDEAMQRVQQTIRRAEAIDRRVTALARAAGGLTPLHRGRAVMQGDRRCLRSYFCTNADRSRRDELEPRA
jgi:hypothetical protein